MTSVYDWDEDYEDDWRGPLCLGCGSGGNGGSLRSGGQSRAQGVFGGRGRCPGPSLRIVAPDRIFAGVTDRRGEETDVNL